ncbi:hypothetical protein BDR26DRAFT_897518 [Obelidium mucronatum]|nr:hypothetical protein BDR26DRAFT_897518 [Obelidium mucronatum]
MMMTLDELGPTLSDYVWVDLVVSVVTNRTDAIYKSDLSVVNNRVIGFTDTEHKLSNHQDYPKFFRTIPSTKFQIQSMLRLMQSIGWTECSFITSSSFSDPQVFLTEAANFGLKIQESYFIDSISACSSIGDTILKSNAMVLVYLGLPGSFSVECFSMLTSKLPYKMGYSWIIDDGASQLLDQQSNSNFPGVFSATIQEGVGPGYDSLLTNWRNISYQNRYPGISFFKTPPRGFMFYRSCLELMLRGYLKKLEDGVVTPAQLSAGPSAAWTNSIKVPESFEFSKNPSATGNVSFIPLTGDRVGTFLIRYCNGSGFYSVGNMDSSAALIVNSTLLAGLGWVKPSFSQSPPVSTATIALSVAGAILFLIIIVFVFRNFRENERGSEKQQETESTTPVGLGISMSGTGQQALNILQRLKEQREHHQKPFLNQVEIDILTDALTSGGNSAYNPTFEITPKNGSAPVDQELQEFLMNTMLAQSKRNTEASYMPPPAPRESDHLKSPPPEMKRERSIFGNLLRTPSGRSLPRESEERDRERSTSPTGMPLNDPESQSSDKIAIRRDKSVFQSPTARPTISRRQRPLSGEVEQPPNLPSVPSGSAEHLSLSAPRPSKTGLVPDDKNQPPRTHTIKIPNGQPLPGGKSRAASIYSHATVKSSLTISRRISAFAQVFVPQSPVPASPSKEFQDASPSTSNLSLSLIPDLTRKFEDFDVLIRPAKDLTQISSAAVQEYLDAAYFTWSIGIINLFHSYCY